MKLRFWQKTYLLTLVLFLVCLNMGILSLTVYTYRKSVESTETTVKAEQSYVAMSFERDYEDLLADYPASADPTLLMQSYAAHYAGQVIFRSGGEVLTPGFAPEVAVETNALLHTQIDGKRHLAVCSEICGGEYELVFLKDVSSLDQEFRSLATAYVLTALGVSVFLAVCLYFILKKLSSPLDRLRKTTQQIEAGDYTVTARAKGSDEFALLAKSFNAMLAKINEQMSALELDAQKKQMLVDNLAHELRTPLTSIRGYAEYLEKAAASPENRIVAARYIISEAERLLKISETLLDGAFIRGNEPEMFQQDVAAIMADVAQKLRPKAVSADVSIRLQGGQLWVWGNETLLSMLLYNLAENAIKACAPGGQVVLGCCGTAATVEDNGKGMTAEQLLHITEPFYRTDKSRSRAEGGAGLGLALCQQIADLHGARLKFDSLPGVGTKITVNFTTSRQV